MATVGLARVVVIGPVLGTAIYQVAPVAPVIVSVVTCALASVLALLTPTARGVPAGRSGHPDA